MPLSSIVDKKNRQFRRTWGRLPAGSTTGQPTSTGSGTSHTLLLSMVNVPATPATTPLLTLRLPVSWTFSGGSADAGVAGTGTDVLRIRKDGVQVGTITFTGTAGTVAFTDGLFPTGSLLEIYPPSPVDATLDQLRIDLIFTS